MERHVARLSLDCAACNIPIRRGEEIVVTAPDDHDQRYAFHDECWVPSERDREATAHPPLN